jgi:hypothetical protein
VAGLDFERARPEVDPINFLPRVATPTLMLNGRYDFFFPIETSQVPMFRLLGTPADQKRHVVEEGSHFVPRTRLIQETLAWLDRYQPVPSGEWGTGGRADGPASHPNNHHRPGAVRSFEKLCSWRERCRSGRACRT